MIALFGKKNTVKHCLTPDAPPKVVAPKPAPAPAPVAVSPTDKATVNVYALNVRTGPGTNYKVLGSVIKGTELQVLGSSGKWLKVKYGNREAYVAGWLVKK